MCKLQIFDCHICNQLTPFNPNQFMLLTHFCLFCVI